MFKNKAKNGSLNICGKKIYELRTRYPSKMSQKILADKLQLLGVDVDKNAIQKLEKGKRFVTDIELKGLSQVFNISCDELLGD